MNLFGITLFGGEEKDYLEEFKKDKQKVSPPFRPIDKDKTDPELEAFDELHGYASKLSRENQNTYNWTLLILTGVGTAIAVAFLLYDELEMHWLSAVFLVLLFLLMAVHAYALMTDCHRKYVEYRILAEATRIQYYLSVADIPKPKPVFEIMPWFLQDAVGWIEEPLSELPLDKVTERKPIIDCWIIDQKNYHTGALKKAKAKNRLNEIIELILISITIFLYVFAFVYDFWLFDFINSLISLSPDTTHIILKLAIGITSVGSLLVVSYFGKLSLSEKIDDHSRMEKLYTQAEKEITTKGETTELLEKLAKEFLIENSTWYSYQIKNKPELVL